uniref:AIG1-type G domain-containing protein n=2 Tax=Mastacembelus armatus TaxID=205130 RepID=A0A3Q3M301_9TELE
GKSSLANTIIGEELFTIDHSLNSETRRCQAETRSVNGRRITVIDTPGFFDTDRSEDQLKPEILRCITKCAPGPHAFLIVLKVERFTEHEQAVITKICQYFSEELLRYATVLFTHGDQLPEGMTLKDVVHQNKFMSELVKKCGSRCHIFDNKYWSENPKDEYRNNQVQVEALLNTIDQMVMENNGDCYTNEMFQEVKEEIKQEEEAIRQTSGNMSEEEIREQAEVRVLERLLIRLAGVTAGALLGALFGVVVMVGVITQILTESSESIKLQQAASKTASAVAAVAFGGGGGTLAGGAAGATVAATGLLLGTVPLACAATGAVKGALTGYDAADGADTPWEAAERALEAVKSEAQSVLDKAKNAFDRLTLAKSEKRQTL